MAVKKKIKTQAEQYIVIKFENEQFGINIKQIDSIVRIQKITRVPNAAEHVKGVINLRGEIIPVMSLREKLGLPTDEFTSKSRIIIVKLDPEAPMGLLVDEAREVVDLEDVNIVKKVKEETENSILSGVGKYEDELVSLLNLHEILDEKTM